MGRALCEAAVETVQTGVRIAAAPSQCQTCSSWTGGTMLVCDYGYGLSRCYSSVQGLCVEHSI